MTADRYRLWIQPVDATPRPRHYYTPITTRRAGTRRGDAGAPTGPGTPITRSLTRVAASVAEELGCRLILAFTESGLTARLVALHRPRVPVVAVTHDDRVYCTLALWWGVVPVKSAFVENTDDLLAAGEERLRARGIVDKGDTILMLSGHSPRRGGHEHAAGAHGLAPER